MHVKVQLRFNPVTGQEAPYYRLKESYRDVRDNLHSLIVLNIGFELTDKASRTEIFRLKPKI